MNSRGLLRCALALSLSFTAAGCVEEVGFSDAAQADPFGVRLVDVEGRSDVPRNQPIQVVFNEELDEVSVDDVAIQLLPGPDYRQRVPLEIRVEGRAATLMHRFPSGLRPGTNYKLRIAGFPKFHAVLARDGRKPYQTFEHRFRTSGAFIPDLEPPRVLSDGSTAHVRSLREISVSFSEAIDPTAVTSGTPFFVEDATGEPVAGKFVCRNRQLRDFRFVPEYEEPIPATYLPGYTLNLSPELTDLAGHPLVGPLQLHYTLDPGAADRVVRFDLTDPVDLYRPAGMLARPNGVTVAPTVSSRELADSPVATWTRDVPRRVQMLFRPEQIGPAGTIHRLYFATEPRPDHPVWVEHAEIRIWRTDRDELSPLFRDNEPEDSTEIEYHPFLWIPAHGAHDFFTVPLRRPAEYDGESNLVLEITHFGASEEIRSLALRDGRIVRLAGSPDESSGQGDASVDDVTFGIAAPGRFVEWIRFEDLGRDPDVQIPSIFGNVPLVEDLVFLEFKGTDQAIDGRAIDEPTPFERRLPRSRFVRFRLHFLRDLPFDFELHRIELPIRY